MVYARYSLGITKQLLHIPVITGVYWFIFVIYLVLQPLDGLTGIRNAWRDIVDPPPPQADDAGDHGEPLPEDDEFDTRPKLPNKAAMDAAIVDFFNFEAPRGSGTGPLCRATSCSIPRIPACPFQVRWFRRDFLCTPRRRQVCCRA